MEHVSQGECRTWLNDLVLTKIFKIVPLTAQNVPILVAHHQERVPTDLEFVAHVNRQATINYKIDTFSFLLWFISSFDWVRWKVFSKLHLLPNCRSFNRILRGHHLQVFSGYLSGLIARMESLSLCLYVCNAYESQNEWKQQNWQKQWKMVFPRRYFSHEALGPGD